MRTFSDNDVFSTRSALGNLSPMELSWDTSTAWWQMPERVCPQTRREGDADEARHSGRDLCDRDRPWPPRIINPRRTPPGPAQPVSQSDGEVLRAVLHRGNPGPDQGGLPKCWHPGLEQAPGRSGPWCCLHARLGLELRG